MIRDEGAPTPLFQSLNYPMIDDRNETPSAREISGLGVWDRENNVAAWKLILGDSAGGPDVSPYAAPARATTFDGLPPTCIIVGELDVFRDEDVNYATRLHAERCRDRASRVSRRLPRMGSIRSRCWFDDGLLPNLVRVSSTRVSTMIRNARCRLGYLASTTA